MRIFFVQQPNYVQEKQPYMIHKLWRAAASKVTFHARWLSNTCLLKWRRGTCQSSPMRLTIVKGNYEWKTMLEMMLAVLSYQCISVYRSLSMRVYLSEYADHSLSYQSLVAESHKVRRRLIYLYRLVCRILKVMHQWEEDN